jgi:regulator of RNase E activity RraA
MEQSALDGEEVEAGEIPREQAVRLNTATIADVLDALGVWGVLDHRIVPCSKGNPRFIGRAYTTRWAPARKGRSIVAVQPSTWSEVQGFLAPDVRDANGIVYVAGADDGLCTDYALAGGLSATDFSQRGFAGVVLGGAIRDLHVVSQLPLPIRATNFTPADTQGNYRVMESGGRCVIGRVTIETNDLVVADETGCVIIPNRIADKVISMALTIESVEADMVDQLKRGERLFDIVNAVGRI